MKASELRGLALDELDAKIQAMRLELFGHRVKHETGQLNNTATLRVGRAVLARALTVRQERSRQA